MVTRLNELASTHSKFSKRILVNDLKKVLSVDARKNLHPALDFDLRQTDREKTKDAALVVVVDKGSKGVVNMLMYTSFAPLKYLHVYENDRKKRKKENDLKKRLAAFFDYLKGFSKPI